MRSTFDTSIASRLLSSLFLCVLGVLRASARTNVET